MNSIRLRHHLIVILTFRWWLTAYTTLSRHSRQQCPRRWKISSSSPTNYNKMGTKWSGRGWARKWRCWRACWSGWFCVIHNVDRYNSWWQFSQQDHQITIRKTRLCTPKQSSIPEWSTLLSPLLLGDRRSTPTSTVVVSTTQQQHWCIRCIVCSKCK